MSRMMDGNCQGLVHAKLGLKRETVVKLMILIPANVGQASLCQQSRHLAMLKAECDDDAA